MAFNGRYRFKRKNIYGCEGKFFFSIFPKQIITVEKVLKDNPSKVLKLFFG